MAVVVVVVADCVGQNAGSGAQCPRARRYRRCCCCARAATAAGSVAATGDGGRRAMRDRRRAAGDGGSGGGGWPNGLSKYGVRGAKPPRPPVVLQLLLLFAPPARGRLL